MGEGCDAGRQEAGSAVEIKPVRLVLSYEEELPEGKCNAPGEGKERIP